MGEKHVTTTLMIGRNGSCGFFRIGDGIGLGQHFGKDQNQKGHDQRCQRHAAFTEQRA